MNIVDGTNLERNLYLTTQLTELGIPVVVAVNMMDVVKKNGDKINIEELSRQLGCKVVEISALKGTGVMAAAEEAIKAVPRRYGRCLSTASPALWNMPLRTLKKPRCTPCRPNSSAGMRSRFLNAMKR